MSSILAVASGKGGVGKSSVCVNLAFAMQRYMGLKAAQLKETRSQVGDIDFLGGYHGCGHLWPFATLPGAKQCGREGLCL